jgi:hypothetical protein
MATDKRTIISGWITRDFESTERVIQLNRDALLIAQSDRLEWFDLFVTVRGQVMTKEMQIPSPEASVLWRGRQCRYTVQFNLSDLKPADNIENAAAAFAPLRLN